MTKLSPRNTVTLMPIGMIVPNKQKVYSPHPYEPDITISKAQFLSVYKKTQVALKVSFEKNPTSETIHESAVIVPAYSVGFNHLYIKK